MSRFTLLFLLLLPTPASAANIVLWNAEELFDTATVNERQADLRRFAQATQPDVLLIDEVCSYEVVERVREVMGLDGYQIACSDFNQRDDQEHASFEVGIISRFPLTRVVEYDQTPDNRMYGRDNEPNELPLEVGSLLKLGVKQAGVGRGFLWARIDDLKLTLCLTHLKSSASGDEAENAMKREHVAAAMALSVLEDMEDFPGYTYLVAGDLNVGETDAKKNGDDLDVDVFSGEGDRYDDTHALLRGGLAGLRMRSLTKDVGETYDDPRYAGSGPIDCIYLAGEGRLTPARKTAETFGSDHFGVWTVWE